MLTQTTCLVTFTQPFEDWKKYRDNLDYNPSENIVLDLRVDGKLRIRQQILLTKIDFNEDELTFRFEGTYGEEAVTGWVKFNKTTKRFETGQVMFG